jgi:6-pyruvoyltetrahydropterin/6-carboxytetrahydropterin synthase
MDFAHIKEAIGSWIDNNLDHRMLLHEMDPVLPFLRQQGEPVFVMTVNPTAENIARLIFDFAAGRRFPVVEVKFWETDRCYATYRSSRG